MPDFFFTTVQAAVALIGNTTTFKQIKESRSSFLLPTGAKLCYNGKEWAIYGYSASGEDIEAYRRYERKYNWTE